MLGVSQSRGLKLFGREIIFKEFQPMCCWYLNITDGTDRRTDGRLTVALPRSALASRGKNGSTYINECITVCRIIRSFKLHLWVYLHSNFHGWLQKHMYFETGCIIAFQGHPRLYHLNSILPVSEILQVFCWKQPPNPYFIADIPLRVDHRSWGFQKRRL